MFYERDTVSYIVIVVYGSCMDDIHGIYRTRERAETELQRVLEMSKDSDTFSYAYVEEIKIED